MIGNIAQQQQSGIGESRSFTYLGPNIASLDVKMNGNVVMADATNIRSWYFGNGFNDDRTVPSPLIEAIEGETVRVTLDSMMPHTIHFHGLDVDQANDGVPSTSGYVSFMPAMGGFGRVEGDTHLGTPFEYTFVAPHAGTYMYHCHVDTVIHLEMGMIGTVIVRPPGGSATQAWSGGPTYDREFVWHLHTFDSSWHGIGPIVSGPTTTLRHRPDYFMINGRDGVNTLNDPTTAIRGIPDGGRVLIRATNIGYQPALVQLGGLMFDVIASDGRPLVAPLTTDQQLVAPGERYDLLLTVPAATDKLATVDYYDIRLASVLGTATTEISSDVPIFEDGFESGDTSMWSSTTP
jgi:FtsP/CotA-like multicopper oxidase with cupredoxin domain